MIPLHAQIQKYEDKLAKIKERDEKRAEAAKENAGTGGRAFGAREAFDLGLINKVVPDGEA
jgi:enoyl-CoA hydratase/carnithine racemase